MMENGADVRRILRIPYVGRNSNISDRVHDAIDVAPNVGIMLGALLIITFPALLDHSLFKCRQKE
ncbi:hypothetical protein [Bradyrhizobium ivorense]|uniref:hypothetical protein n=2 Tax=Bradyrhizobium ivorense TaxID=2511166 RepID=UPI001115D39E|nr:hypothetical protein [Bradyrhizobium ivorense]